VKNLLISAAVAGMFVLRCGSLTMEPLAGGSGAGNPGNTIVRAGTVVLSLCATGGLDQVINIVAPAAKKNSDVLLDSTGSITVADRGGLRFTLTGVSVSGIAASFMLDSALEPEDLLAHMADRPPELESDTHSIVFSGSHEFDAVDGKVDSAVAVLRLPVARYSGVSIGFEDYSRDFPNNLPGPVYSRITMSGTFLYGGALHDLVIEINYSPQPNQRDFSFGGGLFTLSADDTTHCELQFDSQQWFSSIDFAAALGNGSLKFDSAGTLNISYTAMNPCVWGLQSAIAADFFSSGKLVVY
jgi:hypothetical protein